jgi:YVTN family beta-propeller protein
MSRGKIMRSQQMRRQLHSAMRISSLFLSVGFFTVCFVSPARAAEQPYWICVSNEKGGDVTIIDGSTQRIVATVPAGKRPRGIHPSPDGRTLYVALSGRPIEGPPQLDANGNPIFKKDDDDDDDKKSDHAADGIGVVDLTTLKFVKKLPSGTDPEQFAVAPDGRHLYISNEDVATLSVMNVETGKVEHIVPVAKEPEGVAFAPGAKTVYVTCETNGDIFAIDVQSNKVAAHFTVPTRPRNVVFLPDGSKGFIPSESSGQLSIFDAVENKVLKTVRLPAGSRPMGLAMSLDGKKLYATTGRGGTVLVIDTSTLQAIHSIPVGKRPWGIALSPDGHRLFAANGPSNDISIIDADTEKEIGRIKAGQSPWGITVVPAPK